MGDQWQDIATAPTDRPFIGGLIKDGKVLAVQLSYWQPFGEFGAFPGDGAYQSDSRDEFDPTHWTQIPAPPVE